MHRISHTNHYHIPFCRSCRTFPNCGFESAITATFRPKRPARCLCTCQWNIAPKRNTRAHYASRRFLKKRNWSIILSTNILKKIYAVYFLVVLRNSKTKPLKKSIMQDAIWNICNVSKTVHTKKAPKLAFLAEHIWKAQICFITLHIAIRIRLFANFLKKKRKTGKMLPRWIWKKKKILRK